MDPNALFSTVVLVKSGVRPWNPKCQNLAHTRPVHLVHIPNGMMAKMSAKNKPNKPERAQTLATSTSRGGLDLAPTWTSCPFAAQIDVAKKHICIA